ncbi:hypothetical protein KZ820_18005 [Sphingomonas sp. RRHST34]|uniref:Permease n=1 Tax=Sphingomonas citri TaxID=2862499 RepID=A0ABS7BSZ1_9SPHN|nr:hypothetical protein [Sphingomonas citri]MBW6532640.1 hypothetical protein [Sphingomonas citri]
MDFMKWLNSLDELLYEVMSWLLFFPLTLWRALFTPLGIMMQIEAEATLPDEKRYGSVLSPPLFLALALLLAHTVATALGQTDKIIANHHGLADLVNDNASALVLRVVVFASFPLFLAARMVRLLGSGLNRTSLQQPFYQQCYPAAIFALGTGLSASLGTDPHPTARAIGHWLAAATILNYWVVETRWFARVLHVGFFRAAGHVLLGLIEGAIFLIVVGFLFTR